MKNKKGLGFLWILMVVGIILILGSVLGLVFFKKIIEALGSKYLFYAVIIGVILVFHEFVSKVLLTIWAWISAIVSKIF